MQTEHTEYYPVSFLLLTFCPKLEANTNITSTRCTTIFQQNSLTKRVKIDESGSSQLTN